MGKTGRQISISGYYHIIIRGNGKQIIFEDRKDRFLFLGLLRRYSMETEVGICAYCLMENHVHLLVGDNHNHKSEMMHNIELCYAGFYNQKYDKCGHLFQGRFLSEAIDTEAYFLTAFRYILKNPEKAGICPANCYEWSSYSLYGDTSSFVDTRKLCALIGDWHDYQCFISQEVAEGEDFLEYDSRKDDNWARLVVRRELGLDNGQIIQTYNRPERNAAIIALKKAGLTGRQIERLTGISRGIIQKIH